MVGYLLDTFFIRLGWIFFSKELGRKVTYKEEAEIFLALFKRLVDDGFIFVSPPNKTEPTKEIQGKIFWDTSSDKMVTYLRNIMPSNLEFLELSDNDENYEQYNQFWYCDCLNIHWIDIDSGKVLDDF